MLSKVVTQVQVLGKSMSQTLRMRWNDITLMSAVEILEVSTVVTSSIG